MSQESSLKQHVRRLVAQLCLILCNPVDYSLLAPLSMEFSRQDYWSELPFPLPGDLSILGIKPSCHALQTDYHLSHQGSLLTKPISYAHGTTGNTVQYLSNTQLFTCTIWPYLHMTDATIYLKVVFKWLLNYFLKWVFLKHAFEILIKILTHTKIYIYIHLNIISSPIICTWYKQDKSKSASIWFEKSVFTGL